MFLVLQIGQIPKLLFNLSHSSHIGICPQTQNKTFGGIDRHITHSSDLNNLSVLILVIYSSSFSPSSSGGFCKALYPSPKNTSLFNPNDESEWIVKCNITTSINIKKIKVFYIF